MSGAQGPAWLLPLILLPWAKWAKGRKCNLLVRERFLSQQVLFFFDVNPTPGVVVDKGPRTQMKYWFRSSYLYKPSIIVVTIQNGWGPCPTELCFGQNCQPPKMDALWNNAHGILFWWNPLKKYRLPTQVNLRDNLLLQTTWLDPLVVVLLGLIPALGGVQVWSKTCQSFVARMVLQQTQSILMIYLLSYHQ